MGILGQVRTGKDQLHWASYGHTLGSRLREIRKIRGYSQEDLAEMVKMSRNAISNLERNENTNGTPGDPRLSTVYRLSRALDVPPVALLPAAGETPGGICVDDDLPVDIHWPGEQEELLFDIPLTSASAGKQPRRVEEQKIRTILPTVLENQDKRRKPGHQNP